MINEPGSAGSGSRFTILTEADVQQDLAVEKEGFEDFNPSNKGNKDIPCKKGSVIDNTKIRKWA